MRWLSKFDPEPLVEEYLFALERERIWYEAIDAHADAEQYQRFGISLLTGLALARGDQVDPATAETARRDLIKLFSLEMFAKLFAPRRRSLLYGDFSRFMKMTGLPQELWPKG